MCDDNWECKGVGSDSEVIRHWNKATNVPPKSWREYNQKLIDEKEG
jgi:hypothetical protein